MGDVLIGTLMVGDCSSRLCVRASRLWDFYDPDDETKLLHTDLVLLDEEGNSIHAQIYPPLTEKFRTLLKEGSVYNLSFMQIRKANRMYKAVENDVMINFTRWTAVEEVIEIPPAFPMITYSLTPIEKILSKMGNNEYFTDVIGAVTMISDAFLIRPRSRQTETFKRIITIRDEGNISLDVTLWGERATSFPAEQLHKDGHSSPQIVIFVGTLVRNFAGSILLSGVSSCRWYINPEVPEAEKLNASMRKVHCPIALPSQSTHYEPRVSAAEHKKISDIKDLNPFQNKKIEWLVTVKIMKIDKSWWYESCKKCLRTTRPHGDTYRCVNPSCNNIGAPNPRYKLAIIAGDDTGDTEFVMFGRIAQRLIKKSADALLATNPPGFIPDEVTRLLEKVFTFNVSFTENTISSGTVSFQVNSIVAEIDDGSPLPLTPTGSQSSSIMLSQDASSSVKDTPSKDPYLALPTAPHSDKTHDKNKVAIHVSKSNPTTKAVPVEASPSASSYTMLQTQQSATKKRSRASPARKPAKKLFVESDAKNDDEDDSAGTPAGHRSSEANV